MRELNITAREEGQRLDKILSKYLNKAPKSFVYKMLRKKNIKLNGKKATGNEKLSKGDQGCIYLERDINSRLKRYAEDESITDICIWYECIGTGSYLIYIGYT